ncbi:putative glucose transporter HXT5 [Talaromyces pinophilus]|nr:putative glucose transporter HXT5 [Talaromyces pinophilus]
MASTEVVAKSAVASDHVEYQDDDVPKHDAAVNAVLNGQAVSGYENLTPWETVKAFKLCTFICFAVAFSAATDGYQISLNGSIIANAGFIARFSTASKNGTPYLVSNILAGWSSIQSVGQVIGMASLPFLSSRYGRKAAMFTYWTILVASVLCESLARTWQVWLVAKLLAGIGVGCLQTTIPTYISEVAPVRIRGGLLMSYSFWWTVGSFFGHLALQMVYEDNPKEYLTSIYTQWAQIGIMFLIYIPLPESPAWCVSAGHLKRAEKELLKLNRGVKDYDVQRQLEILSLAVEHERALAAEQRKEHWYAIFRGTDRLRTIVSMWTNLTQQFIGLTLFGTYGTYFFQQAGLKDAFKITAITSSLQIASVIFTVLTADYIGRRRIACFATTVCWFADVVIGIIGVAPRHGASTTVFLVFACIWYLGLAANGATGWGYIGEISSQRLRPYTAGFSAATTAVAGIVMNQLVPHMVNANEWNWNLKTGWFYAGIGLPFTVGMWLLIPETSNRSNAEIDELFERKIKPWRFHQTETATQRLLNADAQMQTEKQ